ncbi:sigma-70 family RNA polymerase sigma factor [Alkalihalobacillus sp. AL-G]|uniref:sigma-70 family RNA polymerase sigma factor n=1 Tax=Alkalihalobacillus sp. AL-G TaxID=2926399 RepID=UPI0027296514|nr:sigma-70 family RNA polymerase sigma factor [Alkalihalobacillus sp. AL-G]WLD91729.1 sigma-70 family RNA polymerase sigma factor [Alkalihalobacillus sp. AL-G]
MPKIEELPLNNMISKEETLIELMDSYGDMVKKLAFTYVKDLSTAEDIAQDVFISCYYNLHQFEERSSYKTWIFRITINKSKDVLKSSAFKRLLPMKKFAIKSNEKNPELKLIDKDRRSSVTQSLMSLNPKYRTIIYMFYYEGLKIKEISEITQLNENTVKTRLSRGKEQLKKEFERRGIEHE